MTLRGVGFLLAIAAAACAAQDSTPKLVARGSVPQAVADAAEVLDVAVTVNGEAVPGLGAKDFTVTDNGAPVKDFEISGPELPSEILFVLDSLNCSFDQLAATRSAITAYLRDNDGQLPVPVSVALIDSYPRKTDREGKSGVATLPIGKSGTMRVLLFSRDGNLLAKELDKEKLAHSALLDAQGSQGDSQRVQTSLQALQIISSAEDVRPGHKFVVWLAPSWQQFSGNRSPDASASYLAYTDVGLRRGRVTLYEINPESLGTGFNFESHAFGSMDIRQDNLGNNIRASSATMAELGAVQVHDVTGGSRVRLADPQNLQLNSLALESGGIVLAGSNDVSAMLHALLRDLPAFYSIWFPAPKTSRPMEFHRIAVSVNRPNVRVRGPVDYYATAPPGSAETTSVPH